MKKKPPSLTEAQTAAMMEGTWGRSQERDRQMLAFLLHTGLKITEFVSLNVGDVFTGQRVRKTLTTRNAPGKLERKVPLGREAREAAAVLLDFNTRYGSTLSPEEPFVTSRQRNRKDGSFRITPRQVQRIVKTLGQDAFLGDRTTPQTFRHTYAASLLNQGKDLRAVQKLLGHRSIKTTRDLYGHAARSR